MQSILKCQYSGKYKIQILCKRMQAYLSESWNYGIAFGEFTSSLLMVFFLFSFEYFINNIIIKTSKKLFKNLFIRPFAFVLSAIVAIVFGWAIGSMIGGEGYGLSLITPLLATLQAFQFWKFNALWFIICFQFVGTLVGFGMFLLYTRTFSNQLEITTFRKINVSNFNLDPSKTLYKSLLFQPLFILALLLIPNLDFTAYGTSLLLNTLLLLLVLFVLSLLTQKNNYFVFSPFISLVQILFFGFKNKQVLKNGFINFAIEFGVQIAFTCLIIPGVIYFHNLTNWY